jgi:hypothetical protein
MQKNSIPPSPYPENPDPKRLLGDELKGPVDPAIAKEHGNLVWMQQKRVWDELGGFENPFLAPIPISLIHTGSSNSGRGATPARSRPEEIALYGPPSRTNESTRLGESLTNPNVIVVDDDDDDDGFDGVLDLYCGAVQGSTLSMELELVVGNDVGSACVGWEGVSSLEVSIKRKSSAPSSYGDPQEPRIRTLAEYKQVIKVNVPPPLEPVTPREESPLGIEWSYSCCGYATGKVVNTRRANRTSRE